MSADSDQKSVTMETDVIIIGNGPSAISLSLYLSGYQPFYTGKLHSNPYIMEKLTAKQDTPLTQQNLEYLCEGLEGRSSNPVALLFDALHHPDADLGSQEPSMLEWKQDEQAAIPHVVLGKQKPGGSWQMMDGSMQTLSRSNWMELPTLPFQEWISQQSRFVPGGNQERASITDVKNYYKHFVKERNLRSNFYDGHIVTSVQKVFMMKNIVDNESGEVEPCCRNVKKNHKFLWEVRGYINIDSSVDNCSNPQREEFCFVAPFVVMACGTFDIPNRLGIPGENSNHCVHSLRELEIEIHRQDLSHSTDPILIIGAGLSAADAVIMALGASIPTIHCFRRGPNDPTLVFKKLPSMMYPEYHHVHKLMKETEIHELYQPLCKHQVTEILDDRRVLLKDTESGVIHTIETALVVILIGAKPDLSFLPDDGKTLGIVSNWPIDSKHNPIDIDPFTYQSVQEPGLFALGPLVGDNFVRFGVGGSLGITNYLTHRKMNEQPD